MCECDLYKAYENRWSEIYSKATGNKKQSKRVLDNGEWSEATPEVQPGGTPSVTEVTEAVEVIVVTTPDVSVMIYVSNVSVGAIVGIAEILVANCANMGLYVLLASSVETIPPVGALIDVLKV